MDNNNNNNIDWEAKWKEYIEKKKERKRNPEFMRCLACGGSDSWRCDCRKAEWINYQKACLGIPYKNHCDFCKDDDKVTFLYKMFDEDEGIAKIICEVCMVQIN
jgi:hypothetical protein